VSIVNSFKVCGVEITPGCGEPEVGLSAKRVSPVHLSAGCWLATVFEKMDVEKNYRQFLGLVQQHHRGGTMLFWPLAG
jgi:hypothetical protein